MIEARCVLFNVFRGHFSDLAVDWEAILLVVVFVNLEAVGSVHATAFTYLTLPELSRRLRLFFLLSLISDTSLDLVNHPLFLLRPSDACFPIQDCKSVQYGLHCHSNLVCSATRTP